MIIINKSVFQITFYFVYNKLFNMHEKVSGIEVADLVLSNNNYIARLENCAKYNFKCLIYTDTDREFI